MLQDPGDYDSLYGEAMLASWAEVDNARRFECGSLNSLGIHALHASLGLLLDTGLNRVFSEVASNVSHLAGGVDQDRFQSLTPAEEHRRGGILTVRPRRGEPGALHRQLSKVGVLCACRGGGIRLSPHFYTPREVLDRALECLHDFSG